MRTLKIAALILVILLLGLLVTVGLNFNSSLDTPRVHSCDKDIISISRGMSFEEILAKLEAKKILEHPLYLRLYVKLSGRSPVIKAGDYMFKSPITPKQVLTTLESGGIELNRLTVIEGWTRFEIANAMAGFKSLHLTKEQALALMNKTALIEDLDPAAKNLEGYLFPDTYFVQSDTKAQDLVKNMVIRFREIWNKIKDKNPNRLTVHNVVTMASVIETEAKLDEERPIVASVILNRVDRRMPLAMDSTVVYASKLAGKWKGNGIIYQSDLDLKSPYNTRKYYGLPPGPVGSPGVKSLQAALNPASTAFIYYVRDPDQNNGKHNFYSSPQEFEVGVSKLRAWEEKERRAGRR